MDGEGNRVIGRAQLVSKTAGLTLAGNPGGATWVLVSSSGPDRWFGKVLTLYSVSSGDDPANAAQS